MIDKKDLVTLYTEENKTTLRVIKAVPEGDIEFKPASKSNSLHTLLRIFVVGNVMNQKFLRGENPDVAMYGEANFTSIVNAAEEYEKASIAFLADLEAIEEDDLQQPFSMWGMQGSRADIILGMLRDIIHHRGQLTVYIRLLNGKLPSVYGPTADEPMETPV